MESTRKTSTANAMPSSGFDGSISDDELATWELVLPPTRIALTCDEVRAVFVGSPLVRGIALLGLPRAQFEKLFPTKARRIRGAEARRVLARASWHQLRAAAKHEGEDAQIHAALAWRLGFGR